MNKERELVLKTEENISKNSYTDETVSEENLKTAYIIPKSSKTLYLFAYWPVYLVYLFQNLINLLYEWMIYIGISAGIILFIAENKILPEYFGIGNIITLRLITDKYEWYSFIGGMFGLNIENTLVAVFLSIAAIALILIIYILPPLLVGAVFVTIGLKHDELFGEKDTKNKFSIIFSNLQDLALLRSKNSLLFSGIINIIILVAIVFALIHFIYQ